VLVADDHVTVREGLVVIIGRQPGMTVVAEPPKVLFGTAAPSSSNAAIKSRAAFCTLGVLPSANGTLFRHTVINNA